MGKILLLSFEDDEDVYQDVNWCNDEDETIVEWLGKSAYTTL